MAGKHAPIPLGKYLEIHATAMRRLERDNRYVLPDGDGLAIVDAERGLLMSGRVRCVGGIAVDVTKLLAIRSGEADGAIVQTTSYTYHVSLEGIGNVLRYCGPHDTPEHPDHKPFHHKHTYGVLHGDSQGTVADVDPQQRPTLAEVIAEACTWYFDHVVEVIAIRGH